MALDEGKILSSNFIFISYSHADADAVSQDMQALLAKGVRVWYDVNMRLGEDWEKIAEQTIRHENCVGVLFYNSPAAFISNAVRKEQALTRKLVEEKGIKYWSVNLDNKLTPNIIQEVLNLSVAHFNEAMLQGNMFNENILCLRRNDTEEVVKQIYDQLAVPYRLVDNEDNVLDDLHRKNMASKDTDEITLGRYIDYEYIGPEQAAGIDDQRFGAYNNLIQLNGVRYSTKELHWKMLYAEEGRAVLLCTTILSQSNYYEGEDFLKGSFASIAFTEEERSKVGQISARYMTAADVEKCVNVHKENALALTNKGRFSHWWINEKGLTENWKQTYSNNASYAKGFSVLIKKGLRPVIEISASNLKK